MHWADILYQVVCRVPPDQEYTWVSAPIIVSLWQRCPAFLNLFNEVEKIFWSGFICWEREGPHTGGKEICTRSWSSEICTSCICSYELVSAYRQKQEFWKSAIQNNVDVMDQWRPGLCLCLSVLSINVKKEDKTAVWNVSRVIISL